MLRLLRPGLLLLAVASFSTRAAADVKLPAVLSDHMVLQRDKPVPIWGTAAADEKVTVKFRDQTQTATAGADGKWKVELAPLKAGGPDALTVSGKNEIALKDILVGEVWVGSGQSNMAGQVRGYEIGDPTLGKLAEKSYPKIRLSQSGGAWKEGTPANIAGFSAILFSFGEMLHHDLDVPVGLMVGAVGGTPSGYWVSEDAFKADPGVQAALKSLLANYDEAKAKEQHEALLKKWDAAAAAAKAAGKGPPPKPNFTKPGEAVGKIGNLYERHIRPMVPFAIRGVLWDQGESGTAVNGIDQFTTMGALVRGWRNEWGQGEFPFICVQKPSGGGCAWDPKDPVTNKGEAFSALPPAVPLDGASRLHYLSIGKHPATYIATASDLGSGIHPTNKSGYGVRAARVALGAVYDRKNEISGPTYKSHVVEGNKVRVSFDHVGQGLAFRHGDKLQGFALAGEDGKFEWANATIDGDTVVLTSDKVSKPAAVYYAAAGRMTWANLFNKDGLPAIPFKTDAAKK